jgi:hypothetical protein
VENGGMGDKLQSRLAPAIIAVVVLLPVILLVLYVAGYFGLPHTSTRFVLENAAGLTISSDRFIGSSKQVTRFYKHPKQVSLYRPAAAVESWLRGVEVNLAVEEDWNQIEFN